jgi:hypothetical protein
VKPLLLALAKRKPAYSISIVEDKDEKENVVKIEVLSSSLKWPTRLISTQITKEDSNPSKPNCVQHLHHIQ